MVTREDVVNAYRYILGREPESESVITTQLSANTVDELRARFLASEEFISKYANEKPEVDVESFMLPLTHSKLQIQVDCEQRQMQALLDRIKGEWEVLGNDEPHWSVLTHDSFKKQALADNKDYFYKTGNYITNIISAFLQRNNLNIDAFDSCLELGCGVGRITIHLSKLFKNVIGVDVSKPHLAICQSELAAGGVDNVSLLCLSDVGQLKKLPRFNFFCSFIVLQHNPPPIIKLILKSILDKLEPGGVAIFQIPTFNENYHFDLTQYLRQPPHMEMHVLPQHEVFSLLRDSNCDLVEVREDGFASGRSRFTLSNTFFAIKR